MKTTYSLTVTVRNKSGAFCYLGKFNSIKSAADYVKSYFGKGWKVTISDEDRIIKSWTLRK